MVYCDEKNKKSGTEMRQKASQTKRLCCGERQGTHDRGERNEAFGGIEEVCIERMCSMRVSGGNFLVRAGFTENSRISSGRQLGKCGNGRCCFRACSRYRKWSFLIWASAQERWKWMVGLPKLPEPAAKKAWSSRELLFRSFATISRKK